MRSQQAYTLIEALISLSIIIIIAAISLSSLRDYFSHANDNLLQRQLMQAIQLAQQEARARYAPIGLCPSKNAQICLGNWSDGWLIFADENEDGVVHQSSQIIRVLSVKAQQGRLYWRSFPTSLKYVSFQANGLMRYNNGTFWYCHTGSVMPAWAMMLSQSGRARFVYPDQQGNIDMGQGRALTCLDK